jgi:hypothetical protein
MFASAVAAGFCVSQTEHLLLLADETAPVAVYAMIAKRHLPEGSTECSCIGGDKRYLIYIIKI